jgi:hypothetical protein
MCCLDCTCRNKKAEAAAAAEAGPSNGRLPPRAKRPPTKLQDGADWDELESEGEKDESEKVDRAMSDQDSGSESD